MSASSASPIRVALRWISEFVFVLDMLMVALLFGVLLVAGVDPFSSTGLTVGIIAGLVILGAHHVWYARHRFELDHDRSRLSARERRGF